MAENNSKTFIVGIVVFVLLVVGAFAMFAKKDVPVDQTQVEMTAAPGAADAGAPAAELTPAPEAAPAPAPAPEVAPAPAAEAAPAPEATPTPEAAPAPEATPEATPETTPAPAQ